MLYLFWTYCCFIYFISCYQPYMACINLFLENSICHNHWQSKYKASYKVKTWRLTISITHLRLYWRMTTHCLNFLNWINSLIPILSKYLKSTKAGNMASISDKFNLKKQFVFYASYHNDPINVMIHLICIWPIFATGVVFLQVG